MKLFKVALCQIIVIALFLTVATISASALSWDGTSAGGGGSGVAATQPGYAIRTTGDNCIGYRFSVVDKNGNVKGYVRDVFRNTTWGNYEINNAHKFYTKYNKKQLINNQNSAYSTGATTSNCLWESGMGFANALPTPDGIWWWQDNEWNLNPVLSWLGIGSISNLVNGDKILVEPIYDVKLQNVYHALTVTEIAIYGKWLLGVNWGYGVSGTNNSGTWSFIVSYTNRHYPNSLYTPDGQGLWFGAWAVTINIDFYNIINGGWGAGIAYVETKPDFSPTLSVNVCEAWKGNRSDRGFYYGNSNGGAFGNFSYGNGYPVLGDSVWFALNFPAESQAVKVRQYVKHGGNWITRDVDLDSADTGSMWFDVIFTGAEGGGSQPTNNVESGRVLYWITARQDWIDANGNILKYGAEKGFYIPIKPKINRYQITMDDITGNQVAKANTDSTNQVGTVYVGQKVYPKYTYTSNNTWTSYNYLRGAIYQWTNGAWNTVYPNNGGTDLYIDNQAMSNTAPYERYSDIGAYTVPDNSLNTNGSNRIPFKLWTHWVSDWPNTTETNWIDIPIIKADAELVDIKLIDENGYYTTSPYVGQKVIPQYCYKNNTNCNIFVEGYDNNGVKLGTFEIPANSEIYVNGNQITIPNQSSYSVWGGVYLDGAGIYNTAWEANGTNNDKTIAFSIISPLTVEFITPNSKYREDTEVITSLKVNNIAPVNFIPSNNISVRFSAYKESTLLYSTIKSGIVIPANGDNLVYFKWRVSNNLNNSNIILIGEVMNEGVVVDTKFFIQGTEKPINSQTPNTQYEAKMPSGFTYNSPPFINSATSKALWSEWVYENNAFVKKDYGLGIHTASKPTLAADAKSPSRYYSGGYSYMKSGYGFTLTYTRSLVSISGKLMPSSVAYTNAQSGYARFPEFRYSTSIGSYRTLLTASNVFYFYPNSFANNARLHFVPIWVRDGDYIVQTTICDQWTPAGMLTVSYNSTLKIIGNIYEDGYIGKQP